MERFLARLIVRVLGPLGTLLLAGASLLSLTLVATLFAGMFLVCMGGTCGLLVLDNLTGSSARATVAGHHWERSVRVEVATIKDGKIRWVTDDTLAREGDNLSPVWPSASDDGCSFIGCRRIASRTERYELSLKMSDGSAETCTVSGESWPKFTLGSPLTVRVGGITGFVSCTSSTPAPAAPPPAPVRGGGKSRRR